MKISDAFKKFDFSWLSVIVVTVLNIFVYTFMEWIFIATMPSFMSSMKFDDSFPIFLTSASLYSGIYLVGIAFIVILSSKLPAQWRNVVIFLSTLIPGVITACLLLLSFDNFAYTVFRYGIVTSRGFFRGLYGAFFIFLIYLSTNEITKLVRKADSIQQNIDHRRKKFAAYVFISIIALVGFLPVILNLADSQSNQFSESLLTERLADSQQKTPHIFLITLEGINAENMSLYGYERETTPFLEKLAETSIIGQNAFTNSASTTGSIISIFTGKYPVDTKVLYPPDILTAEDAYQHLPAILKQNGYTTAQYSFGRYVDVYQLNVKNGFDEANGRFYKSNILNKLHQWLPNNSGYFLYECGNRIYDRLLHIFFIRLMPNPIVEVSSPTNYDDYDKLDSVLKLLDTSETPVFVHLHWMGTHGPKFSPLTQVFSAGKDEVTQAQWDPDFYDDSILEVDQALESFYDELSQRGLAENSVFVIVSDHGQHWVSNKRLPLLIRFPEGEFSQSITHNVQNMDIAPTLLDYLGISKPQWMSGSSLLEGMPDNRPIFAFSVGNIAHEGGEVATYAVKPPFYQFGSASVIICDTWYGINLTKLTRDEQTIDDYVGECIDSPPSQSQVLQLFVDLFESYGYDTTSLIDMME